MYRWMAERGTAPLLADVAEWVGGEEAALATLERLHVAHQLVLGIDRTSIQMVLPFSAVPTPHRVESGDRSWWANCAWDALAIPLLLDLDATIESRWVDTDEPVRLQVVDRSLVNDEGFVHYELPARRWWEDIVET